MRFAWWICLIGLVESLPAVTITRGPYLQLQTTNSVVIRWRTDAPTVGKVFYGEEFNRLDLKATAAGLHTEHVVQLTGLKPATKYFYAVGEVKKETDLLLQPVEEQRYLVTAPDAPLTRPTRVWVVGDSGTANKNARRVKEAFLKFNQGLPIDVFLMLGDNAYDSGKDSEYQKAVFEMYPEVLANTVLWPTLGNHDGQSASSATQSGVYYDIFTLPTMAQAGGLMSGTEAYYSFDFSNIHFICLDSYDSDRSPDGPMVTWLKFDLARTRQEWVICYFHHPPYTKGSHDSDDPKDSDGRLKEMREWVLPTLEAGGVDLVLAGHSHSYERSFLLDGHYGDSKTLRPSMILNKGSGRENGTGAYTKKSNGPAPHQGTVYTVAGSSGQKSGGKLNHPAMYLSLNELGSLVLDVNGARLDGWFLDDRGRLKDRFTILKGVE